MDGFCNLFLIWQQQSDTWHCEDQATQSRCNVYRPGGIGRFKYFPFPVYIFVCVICRSWFIATDLSVYLNSFSRIPDFHLSHVQVCLTEVASHIKGVDLKRGRDTRFVTLGLDWSKWKQMVSIKLLPKRMVFTKDQWNYILSGFHLPVVRSGFTSFR